MKLRRKRTNKMKNRSRMASAVNDKLDQAVFTWYNLKRKQGIVVCGSRIKAKALHLNELMGGSNDFLASTGWLSRWKSRYGIRLQANFGKNRSTFDSPELNNFSQELQRVVEAEHLSQDQVFSCVETSLNYKMLPSKASSSRLDENVEEIQKKRDCVTVMACSNASGSLMLPLMVVGKYPKPRGLKDLKMDNLPILYRNDKNAQMNPQLFREWFNGEFVPRVGKFLEERKLPQQALLIIDNSPLHPPAENLRVGTIKTMFFPLDVTSLMRPMDQSILESLKRSYRYRLIKSVSEVQNVNGNVIQHLKGITLRNVVFWLSGSWEKITGSTIKKAWSKIWPERDSDVDNRVRCAHKHGDVSNTQFLNVPHQIEGCQEVDKMNLEQWIRRDDQTMEDLSDQKIISMVMENGQSEENNEQEDTVSSKSNAATSGKARDFFQIEECHKENEDYSQLIKIEYTDMAPLSDHGVILMKEEIIDQENRSLSDCKVNKPVGTLGFRNIEENLDMDEENLWKRIKREFEAGDPLSNQVTISMAMEAGEVEENGVKENKYAFINEVVTAAEAKDAAALLIHFFENQADTPQDGLMWLHMFKHRAASMKMQQQRE